MPLLTARVTPLILEELARGERRVLSLTVAVGRQMERTGGVRENLATTVKSALRALVTSKEIIESGDGLYSLARRK
jgi:hypothetical protein